MTRIGRPLTGTAADAGRLDGRCDAFNERTCNPEGRWRSWHAMRPESDWPEYRDAYEAAHTHESAYAAAVKARQQGATP